MAFRKENLEQLTLTEMEEFLNAHGRVKIGSAERNGNYRLVERVLCARGCRRLKKGETRTVRRFPAKVTALSRAN
jgi:hypothetical protein